MASVFTPLLEELDFFGLGRNRISLRSREPLPEDWPHSNVGGVRVVSPLRAEPALLLDDTPGLFGESGCTMPPQMGQFAGHQLRQG